MISRAGARGAMSAPGALFQLSPGVFRAIASPRRVDMLRLLAERPHTPTELARRLGVSEATARQHLDVLRRSRLAERREDGRVWAYHVLTDEGRALLRAGVGAPAAAGLAAFALAGLGAVLLWRWDALRPEPLPPGSMGMPIPPDPSLPWLAAGAFAALAAAALLALACLALARALRRLRA